MTDRSAALTKLLAEAKECEKTAPHSVYPEMRDHFRKLAADLRQQAVALARS